MAEFGGGNPFPLEIGGGKSTTEQIYEDLKYASGIGGHAADYTIEGEWRFAQARGIRAGMSVHRAVNQHFPNLATSNIGDWEDIFLLAPGDLSDEARRDAVMDRYSRQIDASGPGIDESLQAIDALFEVVGVDVDTATVTIPGRAFQDWNPSDPEACGPAFGGGRESTAYPAFSDYYYCTVKYDIPAGVPSVEAQNRIQRAEEALNEMLPAWVDYRFTYGTAGFYLDISLLDLGSFS